MALQKFRADGIFTGTQMLGSDHVLICDSRGYIIDLADVNEGGDDVRSLPGLLVPGFINCHCHLELSHMKGLIPEKTGLVNFVFNVVKQRHFPEDEIMEAIDAAEREMMQAGIVGVGDICNNLLSLPQKSKQNLSYYNFIEASGWLPAVAQSRAERAAAILDSFSNVQMLSPGGSSIVPHAPYSVSGELWKYITPYFENKTVSIHNQETAFEDEFFLKGTGDFTRMYELMKIDNSFHVAPGETSLRSYFGKLAGAKGVLLVHNSYTAVSDIRFAEQSAREARQQLYWCICINANKYIEEKIPPIEALVRERVKIVLGTDSLASNHSLSVLEEMKTLTGNFPAIKLSDMLQWATCNGAKALQMDDMLGTFEKGKKPGIVLIENLEGERLTPQSSAKRLL